MVIVFGKQEKVEKKGAERWPVAPSRGVRPHVDCGARGCRGPDTEWRRPCPREQDLRGGAWACPGWSHAVGTLAASLSGRTLGGLGLLPTVRPLLPAHPPSCLSLSATGRVFLSTLGPRSVSSVWAIK